MSPATLTREPPTRQRETENPKLYVGKRMAITPERWTSHYGYPPGQTPPQGALDARVFVLVPGSSELEDLEHFAYHSPDGFEWGYLGSGPAELARCILLDHFGLAARPGAGSSYCNEVYDPATGEAVRLPVTYQRFKEDVIAKLDRDEWKLPGTDVERWCQRQT